MTTASYKVIDEEYMTQKQVTGHNGKIYNTVADEVVGKWFIMVQLQNGIVGCATHSNKSKALELAIEEAKNK